MGRKAKHYSTCTKQMFMLKSNQREMDYYNLILEQCSRQVAEKPSVLMSEPPTLACQLNHIAAYLLNLYPSIRKLNKNPVSRFKLHN